MHGEEREKLIALMSAVLLAPQFDVLQLGQKEENELLHDPAVTGAIRTARLMCNAVEDEEQRHDSVVFEDPREREQSEADVAKATRRLEELGEKQQPKRRQET